MRQKQPCVAGLYLNGELLFEHSAASAQCPRTTEQVVAQAAFVCQPDLVREFPRQGEQQWGSISYSLGICLRPRAELEDTTGRNAQVLLLADQGPL